MSKNPILFRITDLEINKSPLDEKIVGIFRYDQSSRQKNGPSLLILAEIHSTLYAYERYLDVINAATEQARYLVSQVDQDPLARFEKLVDRLNKASADFTAQEATPLSWTRINLFVVEFSDGQMCLTGTGHLMNLFIQKQEDGSYRNFDIIGSLEQPPLPDPTKPFSSIICGEMKEGDVFMLGTTNFERFRSDLQLKEHLINSPAVTAALDIKQEIEHRHIPDDFVAAIITCVEEKPIEVQETKDIPKETSTSSVEKLREAETQASKHLDPVAAPTQVIRDSKKIIHQVKQIFPTIQQYAARVLRRKTSSTGSERPKDPVALASLRGMNAGYGSRFTAKHKTLAIRIGAGVCVLLIGGAWWNHSMNVAAEVADWQSKYDQIVDLKNRTDSDLIYGNDGKASAELNEATQILATLSTNTPERKKQFDALDLSLQEVRNKLRKIIVLNNGTELSTLAPDTAPKSLNGLVLSGDMLFAVDNSQHAVLKINLLNKDIKRISLPDTATSRLISGTKSKNGALFSDESHQLYALNAQDNLIQSTPWSHAKSSSTKEIVLYSNRLYSLDSTNGQIWRYSGSTSGYSNEVSYVKAANTSLTNSISLAIDSNVYALKTDGTIAQFAQGGQTGFSLLPIDPALSSPTDIWTEFESTLIAIADPQNKRIVLYDKAGALHAQIQSSQFQEPSEVAIDEQNKRIAVIDGNRVLLFPLP